MDIRNIWKKCCETTKNIWQKVCQGTKSVWGLFLGVLGTISYTTYGIVAAGFVVVIAVVSVMHHTKDGVGVLVGKLDSAEQKLAGLPAQLSSTEQKLAALEKKIDADASNVLSEKLTSTEQRLESLEKKLDGIQEKQDSAHLAMVNEKIRNEVERQVIAQHMEKKVLKEKRKKVLRNMLDAIADDQ